ncbi:inactive transglutaminase family protein [Aeromonas simiae]|uniref:inactive transglutaminase family protein n=1 Tax=Aeromonas simiae TaxID=218936 RepID=UPI0005A74076|nr:inactive transglutaminase family protein [Aeromonas simiae]MDO2946897.1 inactive transglutaminase family protein [Aeromonas simiae]MDO2951302.1 inactive transglutaminase family protein [Aeromonas simiae]MDO2954509.1 inactive transglutaminase family protein [Aeromonas simiae]
MVSRKPFYLLVALLYLVGLGMTIYHHVALDVPLTPGEKRQIWSIEAKLEFDATGEPVIASLAIPGTQEGFTLMNENAASPGYGLSFVEKGGDARAEWSIRTAAGRQELYYRVDMMADAYAKPALLPQPPAIEKEIESEPYATAMAQILERAQERSADPYTLTREIIKEMDNQNQNAELLKNHKRRANLIAQLLNNADVPARVVHALQLEDGRRRQELVDYLQVFRGKEYQLFNPKSGEQGQPANLLLWEYNSGSLLDVTGGHNSRVTFSMIEQEQPVGVALAKKYESSEWLNFSIHSLPLEEQTLFKGLLLIPIGVLMVVFLRVIVGIKTSGTFMPVLIAVAFIQTQLITGLVGFLLIVGTGLIIRSYLSRLNLLLVARISAVIIMVISMIGIFSALAFKLGLTNGMKITFFPMIILSWTIERMSILWEEEGPKEVVKQGGGSLLVAVIAYLAMDNELIRHLTFNFLGLQLVLMATVLLLGNYTGYKLSELKRFKPLVDEMNADKDKR